MYHTAGAKPDLPHLQTYMYRHLSLVPCRHAQRMPPLRHRYPLSTPASPHHVCPSRFQGASHRRGAAAAAATPSVAQPSTSTCRARRLRGWPSWRRCYLRRRSSCRPPPHGAGPAPSPPCLEPLVERPLPAASDESVVLLPWPTALGGRPAAVAAALITGLAGHTLHARGGCPVPVQVLLEKENDDDVRHTVTACEAPLTTASAATSAAATVAAAAGAAVRGADGRAPRGASPDDARAVAALAARLRALTSAVAAFCAAPPGVTAAAVVFTRPAGRAAGSLRVGGAPRVADDLYMLRFVGEGWVNDGGGGRPCAAVGEEMGAGGGPGGGPGGGERHAAAVDAAVRTLLRAVVARTSGSAYLGRALRTLGGEGVGGNVGDGRGVDARGLDSC